MSLQSDINSLVRSVDLELFDISIVNEGEETIYRVSVLSNEVVGAKRKGVSLDACVDLTHLISPLLDVYARSFFNKLMVREYFLLEMINNFNMYLKYENIRGISFKR